MKKKILKAAFVATFAMIAGYGVYNSQKDVVLSDVALANVEALASGESGKSDCEVYCASDPNYTCIVKYTNNTYVTCYRHKKG